jgi:hypothetical protein
VASPEPDDPPANAVVGNELPSELTGYTLFGKPASEYQVTEVSTTAFEKVRNLDQLPSEPLRYEDVYEDFEGNGDIASCEGGHRYQPDEGYDFAVYEDEAACMGYSGGKTTPGVLRDGVFEEFIGYESFLDGLAPRMINTLTVTEETAIWTTLDESSDHVTEWLMFAGDLTTRQATLLVRSSDPVLELGVTGRDREPYLSAVIDGRVLFVLDTETTSDDFMWQESQGELDFGAGSPLTEALFSINLDGTDLRKELDPMVLTNYDLGRNPDALLLTASATHYSALKRTAPGEFEEVFTVAWDTEYMPHPSDLLSWNQLQDSTLTIATGTHILIVRQDSGTLTIVRDAAGMGNGEGNYAQPPWISGKHVSWIHYRYNSDTYGYTDIMGIYVLNLETHKGLMTVTYNGYTQPSNDGEYLELIKYQNPESSTSNALEKILIPLP